MAKDPRSTAAAAKIGTRKVTKKVAKKGTFTNPVKPTHRPRTTPGSNKGGALRGQARAAQVRKAQPAKRTAAKRTTGSLRTTGKIPVAARKPRA